MVMHVLWNVMGDDENCAGEDGSLIGPGLSIFQRDSK
jgi:hypothetical protein